MTVLGFRLVLGVLLLVYRKVDAAAPLIPIVAVVGWNAVAMTVLGIDYTPLTATLGAMTIGVAAKYTILVLERFLEEREKTGDVYVAIEHSVQKIGRAITVSGLATIAAFSALCVSNFPMISNFGITTVIAVGFSLIGVIVLMPAALVAVDRVQTRIEHRREALAGTVADCSSLFLPLHAQTIYHDDGDRGGRTGPFLRHGAGRGRGLVRGLRG